MTAVEKYSLAMGTDVVCRILNIDPSIMLQKAGLSHLATGRRELRVTAQQYFAAWNTVDELAERSDYLVDLGIKMARGPVIPVFFALACAPNLEIGIRRLAHYKMLLGPTCVKSYWKSNNLCIEFASIDTSQDMPSSLAALHLVVLVEQARTATGSNIHPISATLKSNEQERHQLAGFLGVLPDYGEIANVSFEKRDTAKPFISENPALWETFEQDLQRQLMNQRDQLSMKARVRSVLVNLLTSGRANVDDVCFELGISRSTLQRRLRDEKTSFREVLDETRQELAIRYLNNSTLRVDEIGAMLGYRDANSFSRSFRRWTGVSPGEFRTPL